MSCPAPGVPPDPAVAGVPAPAVRPRAAEAPPSLRALLRPGVDPDVRSWLAALRESSPCWPPPVAHAGPSTRVPMTAVRRDVVRPPGTLADVDRCGGRRREVPCVRVERAGVTCPACGTITPVVERRIGPRLPDCDCFLAICAHFPLARVASR